jgi:(4S)-4-hydroxy-5-phosphonooxypentane-2,3-dione isomerase
MLIVLVQVQVKPEFISEFKTASIENARESLKEAGIARFDVLQQEGDPSRFLLVEVYRNAEAPAEHKKTSHYQKWRDTVEVMMAVPRSSTKYANLHPEDAAW